MGQGPSTPNTIKTYSTSINNKDISDINSEYYYFRMSPSFNTNSEKYFWLNDIVTIAIGRLISGGVVYKIFKIK